MAGGGGSCASPHLSGQRALGQAWGCGAEGQAPEHPEPRTSRPGDHGGVDNGVHRLQTLSVAGVGGILSVAGGHEVVLWLVAVNALCSC